MTEIQVGNGVMHDLTDINGLIDYAWSHAIISDQVYHGIVKECDFGKENQTRACDLHVARLLEDYSEIDIYSIYSPICLNKYQRRVSAKLVVAPHFLTRHVSLVLIPKVFFVGQQLLKLYIGQLQLDPLKIRDQSPSFFFGGSHLGPILKYLFLNQKKVSLFLLDSH